MDKLLSVFFYSLFLSVFCPAWTFGQVPLHAKAFDQSTLNLKSGDQKASESAPVTRETDEKIGEDSEVVFFENPNGSKVLVSGGTAYPLKVILDNLGLSEKKLTELEGKKVLSVGEGYSDLLPHLLKNKVDVFAMDPIYDEALPNNTTGAKIKTYIKRYHDRLYSDSCLDMPTDQLRGYDLVVSHQLLNNMNDEDAADCMMNSIYLTKKGGSAIFACLDKLSAAIFRDVALAEIPRIRVITTHIGAVQFDVVNPEPYIHLPFVEIEDCWRLTFEIPK